MKDNNKRTFLGIIVIATLVIAIIGGTFAFFSASGGSANDVLTANATTLANLGFTSSHSKVATNLVPVASENPYFYRYPGVASSGEHSCLDDVGNEICSIYEFTVTNTASVAQTIYVSFVPSENTFDNMYFAAFNTSIASASYVVATGSNGSGSNFVLTPQTTSGNSTLGHQATKLTKNSTTPIDMPGLSTSLGAGESVTYTILVWLQETRSDQNTEQGGAFKAGVNVTTGGNATGVTGILGNSSTSVVYTVNLDSHLVEIDYLIPDEVVKYKSASSAMSVFGHSVALKHTVTDKIWIVVGDNGYNSLEADNVYFTTSSSCITDNGGTSVVENGVTYTCQSVAGNVPIESYVVFTVTDSMASANPGMQVGIFELRGGDDGLSYAANIDIIRTVFGCDTYPSRCTDETDEYFGDIDGFEVAVTNDGSVGVYGDISLDIADWSCQINDYTSHCFH